MKKLLIIVLSISLMFSLAGCMSDAELAEYNKQLEVDKGSKALANSLRNTAGTIAKNQNILENKIPIPEIEWSNNRANIVKRLQSFGSDPNKISWIYCYTSNGQLILFSSVKGCVTNLSAYAVPDDQIVDYMSSNVPDTATVVQAPDADGTYGTNGDGIYWYDSADIYHEWNGYYMLVDQPVKLNVEPIMIINVE